MKLVVLAQTPPPVHGQSLMAAALVAGLPTQGVAVRHVPLALSRDAADIGRWRPGKIFATLAAGIRAAAASFDQQGDTLYYIPAPAKRGALYRDFALMLLCRPFFSRLVLHWHASGLADWLAREATALERALARRLLGRAEVALVLADRLRGDAEYFFPKKIVVVPNGIADPGEPAPPARAAGIFQVLFLGLCSEEKGLFAAAEAVLAVNEARAAGERTPAARLVAAGSFPDAPTERRFRELEADHPDTFHYVGPVDEPQKNALLRESHCFCLPTRHAPEGQPLVLLEAMAHDLPIVATRWRAIPDTVPPEALLVAPGASAALAAALIQVRDHPPPRGIFRRHFLQHYTLDRHLTRLAAAIRLP